jgi:hypothetical protein
MDFSQDVESQDTAAPKLLSNVRALVEQLREQERLIASQEAALKRLQDGHTRLIMEMIPEGLELAWKIILKNLAAAFRRTTQWSQETRRFLIIVYMYYLLLFTIIPLLLQCIVRAVLGNVLGISV